MVLEDESASRSRPSRRQLLAASGVGLAASLGGCAEVRTRRLSNPETVEGDDGVDLRYELDGDRVVEVRLLERWSEEPTTPYRITLAVQQPPETRLERIRYELRPRGRETSLEPEFSLIRPAVSEHEPIEFRRGEESGTTVLAVPEFGVQGDGTTTLSLLVDPRVDAAFDLHVDVGGTLEEEGLLGRTYELEGELVRALPGYDQLRE